MSKRLILVLIGLSLLLSFHLYSARTSDLQAAKEQACKLVDEGKFTEASALIETIISDNSGEPDLPEALYWIAERYRWAHKWQEAKDLYQYIKENYPDSPYASRANLATARAEILALIGSKNFAGAEKAFDKMIEDSNQPGLYDETDMPETLYWIARGFGYGEKHEIEKQIYQQIAEDYPDSTFAPKAQLGAARAQIQAFIDSYHLEEAKKAIGKIKNDFASHPDLQDAIYWIGARYEWIDKYKDAIELYSEVIAKEPNNPSTDKAKLAFARTNIKLLIKSLEIDKAKDALDKMVSDFYATEPIPYDALEWLGEKYEIVGQADIARGMFEQTANNCPRNEKAFILAKAHLAKYELFSAIEAGDINAVDTKVSQMGRELAGITGYIDVYLMTLGQTCYAKGWNIKTKGDANDAYDYFETAIKFWERVFTEYPNSPEAAGACFISAAQSAQELGDYAKAVDYFQKVVDDWPEYKHTPLALLKVAGYLKAMVNSGLLPPEETKPAIIASYQALIDNYPDSIYVEKALKMLKEYQQ